LADCTNGRIDWEKVRKSRSKFWAERRPAKDVAATAYHEICAELVGTSMLGSDEMRDGVEHQIEEVDQTPPVLWTTKMGVRRPRRMRVRRPLLQSSST